MNKPTGFVAYDELMAQYETLEADYAAAIMCIRLLVESRVNMKLNVNHNRRAEFVQAEKLAYEMAHLIVSKVDE